MNTLLLLITGLILLTTTAIAQTNSLLTEKEWKKVNEKNGVTVYVNETGHSQIIKVKTEVVVNTSINLIQTILNDVEHRNNWIPFLIESRVLQTLSPTEQLEYSIFYSPWPASNRDFIYRLSLYRNDDNKVIYSMISEASALMPEQNGMVRAQLIESYYTLTSLGKKKTKVELSFHADPKGWIPTWIINIFQRVLPYMILKNLKALAEK